MVLALGVLASLVSWQSSFIWEKFGFGLAFVVPAAVLLGGLSLVRPPLVVGHWNRWAGLLLLGSLAWGALGFYSAESGTLKASSLGGDFGLRIIGDPNALGALRLAGIGLLAVAFFAPRRSWRIVRWYAQAIGRDLSRMARRVRLTLVGGVRWAADRIAKWGKAAWALALLLGKGAAAWPRLRMLAAATGAANGIRGLAARPARRGRPSTAGTPNAILPEVPPVARRQVGEMETVEGWPGDAAGVEVAEGPRTPSTFQEEVASAGVSGVGLSYAAELPLGAEREGEAWQLPPLEILGDSPAGVPSYAENTGRATAIEDALASYGIEARVVEINPGPAVTQFGVEPGWARRYREIRLRDDTGRPMLDEDGTPLVRREEVSRTRVKVDAITNLDKDLALALAAPSIRIEAPVPGKPIVGIEVPNSQFELVGLRSLLETPDFQKLKAKSRLALALGKGASGESQVADLATMPHLLIAGATGSGKSICLRAVLVCLLMHATPEDLRLLLIDPKRVELVAFNSVPHLLQPVIVDVEKVVQVLKDTIHEMEERYKRLAEVGVRNLESYNKHRHVTEPLPYLVIVIDELADLMMSAPFDVEHSLTRLAQLGRATGIHLVVATQRPSVDVVTGLIKANFPTRISFAVSSFVDSRTILDTVGAEKLLGRGDMLYLPQDAPKPKRIQGVFVSDQEVELLVRAWNSQRPPAAPPSMPVPLAQPAPGRPPQKDGDPLMPQARELARQYSRLSVSLLQRRLQIGYTKAARLVELLGEEGHSVTSPETSP